MAAPRHCYRHPDREPRVSCAACGKPICTECMIQTDVGIKCPDDARLPRGARAGVMKPDQIAKTAGAGALVAVAGIAVIYIILQIGFGSLILSGVAGYGAGTLIYRAGGHNGGPLAITVSVVAILAAFAFYPLFLGYAFSTGLLLPALVAVVLSIIASRG